MQDGSAGRAAAVIVVAGIVKAAMRDGVGPLVLDWSVSRSGDDPAELTVQLKPIVLSEDQLGALVQAYYGM